MSFLYPFFFISSVLLAVPILIHLFNLRRYKTVFFPHTRFLKNIQLNSRRQSQVRYKWLLFFRLLFLVFLILAFAQPFFSRQNNTSNRLQIIYLDNSYSMSVKNGARRLFDIARDAAVKQVRQASPGTRFLLLTNDRVTGYKPMLPDKVLSLLNHTDISPTNKSFAQILSTAQSLMQNEGKASLYYYSDFQQRNFNIPSDSSLLRNIDFYGVPIQVKQPRNIFVDTAFLLTPSLQINQTNQLVIKTKKIGEAPKEPTVLQLNVNGQVKSAASLNFSSQNESIDTLGFQVNNAGWQQILLTVNDAVKYDDSFRITARSAPNLSILVLNEGEPNPYIQAAFHSYSGFRLMQANINKPPADFKEYNLIILNNVVQTNTALSKSLANALQSGKSICVFPGRTNNITALNTTLEEFADIQIAGIDTATQAVSGLQQGSGLVKDLFEKIPENVQLPVTTWHYIIKAGLIANEQSVLSFRNGDPFFAKYNPSKGALYVCASDLQTGNFADSYFFVPFLYQMAVQSAGGDVYAITSGVQQAAYIPLDNANERNMVHLYGDGIDAIPSQRANGAGLDVYIDQSVQQPGFYGLAAQGTDSVQIALNPDKNESALATWNVNSLKNMLNKRAQWLEINAANNFNHMANTGSFPLWKVCAILALLMLAAETILLTGSLRKQNITTQ